MTPDDIRAVRNARGLSQKEFADLLGVHRMTVSRWERGTLKVPHWVPLVLKPLRSK